MQKNLLNKIIICFVILTCVLCAGVSADGINAEFSGNELTLTCGNSKAFGTTVYVFEGKLGADTQIDADLLRGGSLRAITVVKESTVTVDFGSSCNDGVYTVIFAGNEPLADRMIYTIKAPANAVETALSAINSAHSSAELANALSANNDLAYMLDLSELESIKNMLYGIISQSGCSDVDELKKFYAAAKSLSDTGSLDRGQLAVVLLNTKDVLKLGDDITKYADDVAARISELSQKGADFSDFGNLKCEAEISLALAAFNNAPRDNKISVIKQYNDIFDVDFSSNLEKVDSYQLAKLLSDVTFDSPDDVESTINSIIDKLYNSQKDESENIVSKSKGGGGGGGGSSGSIASQVVVPQDLRLYEQISDSALFNDLYGYDWATEAINSLAAQNVMTGDGNGSFRPGDNLKREELVKILVNSFGKGKISDTAIGFDDVNDGEWYTPFIKTAFLNKIVTGITDTHFGTGEYVTRQDAAVMIVRAMDAYYRTVEKKITLVDFADIEEISEYAAKSVDILARAGIINGFEDGTFRPKKYISRAEIAKVIHGCLSE